MPANSVARREMEKVVAPLITTDKVLVPEDIEGIRILIDSHYRAGNILFSWTRALKSLLSVKQPPAVIEAVCDLLSHVMTTRHFSFEKATIVEVVKIVRGQVLVRAQTVLAGVRTLQKIEATHDAGPCTAQEEAKQGIASQECYFDTCLDDTTNLLLIAFKEADISNLNSLVNLYSQIVREHIRMSPMCPALRTWIAVDRTHYLLLRLIKESDRRRSEAIFNAYLRTILATLELYEHKIDYEAEKGEYMNGRRGPLSWVQHAMDWCSYCFGRIQIEHYFIFLKTLLTKLWLSPTSTSMTTCISTVWINQEMLKWSALLRKQEDSHPKKTELVRSILKLLVSTAEADSPDIGDPLPRQFLVRILVKSPLMHALCLPAVEAEHQKEMELLRQRYSDVSSFMNRRHQQLPAKRGSDSSSTSAPTPKKQAVAPPTAQQAKPSAATKPIAASVAAKPVAPSVATKPDATKPVATTPVAAKPVAAKPVAAKPVAAKPVAAKPVAAKPVATKPVAAKPVALSVATEPDATKPVATKPVAAKPVATKPVAAKPVAPSVATEPVATTPVATKPQAKQPIASPDKAAALLLLSLSSSATKANSIQNLLS